MKVLIIEDEDIAAEKLELMLRDIDPDIEILGRMGSVKESVKWLFQNTADLIFLDIQLSDGISFSIFEQVTVNIPVIFTTAYDQYAIKAFNVNSISYLLKPIRKRDLANSLQKYHSLKSAFTIDFESILNQLQGGNPDFKKRFLIQIGDKMKRVDVSDVAYFFAYDKGVFLRTFPGNAYPVDFSLDKLENILDPAIFFRINRKYLVNMEAIANMVVYSRGRIKLALKPVADNDMDTIVSIDRAVGFKKWLNS